MNTQKIKEEYKNNNAVNAANAAPVGNMQLNVADFWNSGTTAIVVAIVAVLVIGLTISIVLTVFGHKARIKCVGHSKYGFYSPLIITFLILMWLGNLVPFYGIVVTLIGLIGAIVMIVLANDRCKK
jgi:hypothetical protein